MKLFRYSRHDLTPDFRFRADRGRSSRAFSLVEMIVVMAIIAIGTTVALYSYAGFRKTLGLDTSASMVTQYLLQAKNRAINEGVPFDMIVDLDSENIWINRLDSFGNIADSRIVENKRLADDVVIDEIIISGVPVTSGIANVRFEPDGRNPLVVLNIRKSTSPASQNESFYAIRLYPVSSEVQTLKKQRL